MDMGDTVIFLLSPPQQGAGQNLKAKVGWDMVIWNLRSWAGGPQSVKPGGL